MAKIDTFKIWSLNYQLVVSVLSAVGPELEALGLETKELLLLDKIERNPYPAQLAGCLSMPKPTVTVYLKRLEAAGLVTREIVPADLRRHRLALTAAGRKTRTRGLALLSSAFGERLARLSASEQATLEALLEKMDSSS